VTTLYAYPITHDSPNALSYVYINVLVLKNCAKNLIHDEHLTYAQIVHKVHTLTVPLLSVQYDH